MRPHRLPAALAILALLVQALAPLGPARAERAVICGAAGPVVVLLDPASGRPLAPEDEHGCCAVCLHCATCPLPVAPAGYGVAAVPPVRTSAPRLVPAAEASARRTPIRVRGPPIALVL